MLRHANAAGKHLLMLLDLESCNMVQAACCMLDVELYRPILAICCDALSDGAHCRICGLQDEKSTNACFYSIRV